MCQSRYPIGDAQYCSTCIASKCSAACKLLLEIEKVALQDALTLLRMCGGFSKLCHIVRTTPPTIATDELSQFHQDVMNCLSECLAIEMSPKAREQAQLSLRHGGLGFRSLAHYCSAAYIASVSSTGSPLATNGNLFDALTAFNTNAISNVALTIDVILDHPHQQHFLSSKLEVAKLHHLLNNSLAADNSQQQSSTVYVFQWLWRYMEHGVRRLNTLSHKTCCEDFNTKI